ncbi:MAG: histidine phosphatase family protein [Anaerolineales bacterium]|nr:histidine phosphatase family protein [Anaerolineales bacterium]
MDKKNTLLYHITLLRHGESVGNANGYHQGQAEFPLTAVGQQQARTLGAYWQRQSVTFDHLIASPQSRTRQTAEILAEVLNLEIEYDPVWKERDNGVYAGLHTDVAQERYPYPEFQPIYQPIGQTGESEWELYLRGGRAIQSILHRPPARYLVVSHGAILNMTLRALLGITPQANFQGARFRFQNTSFVTLTYRPDHHQWTVLGVNQCPHLETAEEE